MDSGIDRLYKERNVKYEKDRKHSKLKQVYRTEKVVVESVKDTDHKFVMASPELAIREDDARRGDNNEVYKATHWIARSDAYRKNGSIGYALRSLTEAEDVLKRGYIPMDEQKKIASVIAERAYRIFLKSADDQGSTNVSYRILQEIEKKWGVTPKKRGLESKVSAFVSIISFVAGLLFLSPKITGNVIANVSVQNYSLVSMGLFGLGLFSAWLFFRWK